MAKTSVIEREKKRTRLEEKYRNKIKELRGAMHDAILAGEDPVEYQEKLQKIPANAHRTRGRTRCRLCGRPRAVYRKFGLCRMCLRKYAMQGYVPGLVKASW